MTKKLLAIHNQTGERIEFGVEDVYPNYERLKDGRNTWWIEIQDYHFCSGEDIFNHHTLYYLHQGKYYNYETQEEMG